MLNISIEKIIEYAVEETLMVASMRLNDRKAGNVIDAIANIKPSLVAEKVLAELSLNHTHFKGTKAVWLTAFIKCNGDLSNSQAISHIRNLVAAGHSSGTQTNNESQEQFVFDTYNPKKD